MGNPQEISRGIVLRALDAEIYYQSIPLTAVHRRLLTTQAHPLSQGLSTEEVFAGRSGFAPGFAGALVIFLHRSAEPR